VAKVQHNKATQPHPFRKVTAFGYFRLLLKNTGEFNWKVRRKNNNSRVSGETTTTKHEAKARVQFKTRTLKLRAVALEFLGK
jgi:uncharacterized protein YegP (UPF0339 family)